ncbi:MAG: hypothetical protein IAG13_33945 [Deltaproteobacteria bacterium]|nr:hypothetical protein [Nannocystaceae bacterium]
MIRTRCSALALFALLSFACDSTPAPAKADPAVEAKAKEDAEAKARLEKRKADREAKAAAEEQGKKDVAAAIEKVSVIPEGTKLPKKIDEACDGVAEAQRGFMKKFHPDTPEEALSTQIGLIKKQCMEMKDIKVATCQKFALQATTDQLKGAINEYLPACMAKYPSK